MQFSLIHSFKISLYYEFLTIYAVVKDLKTPLITNLLKGALLYLRQFSAT